MANNEGVKTDLLSFLTKHSKKITIFLVSFCMISIVAAGITYWQYSSVSVPQDTLAQIGSDAITKSDLNARIYGVNLQGTAENPTIDMSSQEKVAFLDELVEDSIVQKESTKNNVVVTSEDVDVFNAANESFESYTNEQRAAVSANVQASLLKEKLKSDLLVKKSGEYVLFRFDKYYKFGEVDFAGEGDSEKIAEQRAYAEKLSQEVATKLKNSEITFEQAKALVGADAMIGGQAFLPVTANMFGDFSGDEYVEQSSFFDNKAYTSFKSTVDKMAAGQTSEPFLVQGYPTDSTEGDKSDIFFAIVKVNESVGGKISTGGKSYEEWLEAKKIEYGVKVYYSKIDGTLTDRQYATNIFLPVAYAATPAVGTITCTASVSGTHYTAYNVYVYYLGTDNLAHPFPNARISIAAGNGTETKMTGANQGCTDIDLYRYHSVSRNANPSGRMQSNWAMQTINGWQKANVAVCAETSTGSIAMYASNPALSGTSSANGSWEFVTTSYSKYGISGQSYDSAWLNTSGTLTSTSSYLYIPLDMGKVGSWTNGTTLTKRGIYKPHWNTAPASSLVTNNGTSTNPTALAAGTTSTVLTSKSDDPNSDKVSIAVKAQRKSGASFVDVGNYPTTTKAWMDTTLSGWGAPIADNTNKSVTLAGLVNGSEYRWCVKSKDEHDAGETLDVDSVCAAGWGYFKVGAGTPPPTQQPSDGLSCDVTPPSGETPLVVQVETTTIRGVVSTFTYDMGDGTPPLSGKRANFWYTYSNPGTYTIKVSSPLINGGVAAVCTTTAGATEVTVTDPTATTGGEVRP